MENQNNGVVSPADVCRELPGVTTVPVAWDLAVKHGRRIQAESVLCAERDEQASEEATGMLVGEGVPARRFM